MTQQHDEETRVERLGPSELFADDQPTTGDTTSDTTGDESVIEQRTPRDSGRGATFYGWLVAIGLVALLTGLAGAIAAAVDYTVTFDWNGAAADANTAGTIGIGSAVILLLILAIAYYYGGKVAGRLARSAGALRGFGVWLIGVVVTAIVAGLTALAGSEYDVLDRMDLPSVPIADETLTTGGLIALGAAALVTLIAAVLGGRSGQRYSA